MTSIDGSVSSGIVAGKKIYFFVNNKNDEIQRHHAEGKFYEDEELAVIKEFFPRGGVFVDIGANVGNHTIYACKFLPLTQAIVIEPNPPAIEILRTNVALNGLDRLVDLSHLGKGLYDKRAHAQGLVPGDEILLDRRVDFIKLDVDGLEMEVLRGLAGTIAKWRPRLFIEVSDQHAQAFETWVNQHGYLTVRRQRRSLYENWMIVPIEALESHDARPALNCPKAENTGRISPASAAPGCLGDIHLINLDRSTDRLERFSRHNPHLRSVVRVSAVDGSSVNRLALVEEGIISDDLPYGPGSLGTALSHIALWRKAVSESRPVTVFEDDVVCSFDFHAEAGRIQEELPSDWDIVQWGFTFSPLFAWLDLGVAHAKLEFYNRRFEGNNVLGFQSHRFARSPHRLAHMFGAFAYSISAKGAALLLRHCLPLKKRLIEFPGAGVVIDDVGIDCTMCSVYGSTQAFVCIPPLVIHDHTQSSNRIELDGLNPT
ncbi:MAG TPA: FkbM family methyltransferase [Dongiaceae bacterium]|jgi:GR25 family glycosyltransferase involved in LPS biosynthesis